MKLWELLDIRPGVTAVIGGGGKTTLIETLARELPGTVLLCTTTHIRRPGRFPVLTDASAEDAAAALARWGTVCLGTDAPEGKLTAPGLPFSLLAELADYVLTEADGSRGLPLKAHAPWEPVIPDTAGQVILVVGLDGLGRPVREVCHRPDRYAALAGLWEDDCVTPEAAARVILAEGLGDRVYLNKAEGGERLRLARELARRLDRPVAAGSLWEGSYQCLY